MNSGKTLRERAAGRFGRVALKTWILIAIGATTGLVGTGLIAFAPEPNRRPAAETAVPVASMVVAPASWAPEIGLFGRIETPHSATLTAQVSATVASLEVREGHRVAAGDVLVQLDETDARLLVRRREAELVEARADLATLELGGSDDRRVLRHQEELHELAVSKVARHRQLREQGTIAQETLNAVLQERHAQAIALSRQHNQVQSLEPRLARAQAHVDRAEAALEEARVALERTRIRAPFPGRVTRLTVAPGELVSPGLAVAEIYDDDALEVRVQIPNAHLPAIESALAAGIKPAAKIDFGSYQAEGQLDRLAGAVAEGQSGVDGLVRLGRDVPPPDLGRAVHLRVTLPAVPNAVAVPVQAVYGQRRLFLVEDGLLVGIDVERVGEVTGSDGRLQLLVQADALEDGARVLTSQLSNAVTGLRVRVDS